MSKTGSKINSDEKTCEDNSGKDSSKKIDSKIFYQNIDPIEPYLGSAWAFTLFLIYIPIYFFPTERFSLLWYFEIYIVTLLAAITIFAIYKRIKYNLSRKNSKKNKLDTEQKK